MLILTLFWRIIERCAREKPQISAVLPMPHGRGGAPAPRNAGVSPESALRGGLAPLGVCPLGGLPPFFFSAVFPFPASRNPATPNRTHGERTMTSSFFQPSNSVFLAQGRGLVRAIFCGSLTRFFCGSLTHFFCGSLTHFFCGSLTRILAD